MLEADHLELPLDRRRGVRLVDMGTSPADRLAGGQMSNSEGRCLAIPVRDLVDNLHRILVATLAHEVLWRLVDVEDEEADKEHDECETSHGDDEPPPPGVLLASARRLGRLAGEVTQQWPGN
jgi:hypothetical protein